MYTMPLTHKLVAITQALLGAGMLLGIWVALPARFLLVDAVGTLAGVCLVGSSLSLATRRPWGLPVARAVAGMSLSLGCVLVTALAWSASHLAGLYGPVGSGGALLMSIVALLVLPYLIGVPALQLAWLRRARSSSAGAPAVDTSGA